MDRLQYTDKTKGNRVLTLLSRIIISLMIASGFTGALGDISGSFGPGKLFEGSYGESIIHFWNSIADLMGNKYFILLGTRAGEGVSSATFLTVTFLLILALTFTIILLGNLWFFLLYALPFFTVPFILGEGPSLLHLFLFVTGLILAAVNKRFQEEISLWNVLSILLIFLMVISVSHMEFVENKLSPPPSAVKFTASAAEKIDHYRFGESPLGDGELVSGQRKIPEGTAMEITMDKPQSMYIRGFTGDTRTDSGWGILPCSVYYNSMNTLSRIRNTGLDPHSQLSRVNTLVNGETEEKNTVKIVNKEASRRYIYMPYEFKGGVIEKSKDWAGSFVTGTGFKGTPEYEYEVSEPVTEKWTELYGEFFTAEKNKEINKYFLAESELNADLYEKYTTMEPGDVVVLNHKIGEPGNQEKGHIGYREAIKKVLDYFEDEVIYLKAFNNGKEEDTSVSAFSAGKAFDVQYASGAALMFRYYGIPARYVEGYVLTPEDVKHMEKGKPYDLPLSNAHAWTEIYIDGFGWVPVETVPEYKKLMKQPDYTKGLENETHLNPFEQDLETSSNNGEQDKETEKNDAEEKTLNLLLTVIIILVSLLLLLLLYLFLRWFLNKRRWEKVFKGEDRKLAVCALLQYMRMKDLAIKEEVLILGEKAAYSRYIPTEEEQKYMYEQKKLAEKEKKKLKKERRKERRRSFFRRGRICIRRKKAKQQ